MPKRYSKKSISETGDNVMNDEREEVIIGKSPLTGLPGRRDLELDIIRIPTLCLPNISKSMICINVRGSSK